MSRPPKMKPSEFPRYTAKDVEDLFEILLTLQDMAAAMEIKKIPVFDKLNRLIKRRKL